MCGRYALAVDAPALIAEFELNADEMPVSEMIHDYNVAPTKRMPIIVESPNGRVAQIARWGFLPTWAKDAAMGSRMINARVETAHSKPAFRSSLSKRRCIVPATGYYEWYKPSAGGPKQPFYIHAPSDETLALAGLYSWWRASEQDPWELTYAIITGPATGDLFPIHDRVPMYVPQSAWAPWLAHEGTGEPSALLQPISDEDVLATPVSTRVNNVRNNGPELLIPLRSDAGSA